MNASSSVASSFASRRVSLAAGWRGAISVLALGALASIGCDPASPSRTTPCTSATPLEGCGRACGDGCPDGLYCENDVCTADCSAAFPCSAGSSCVAGRCEASMDGAVVDAATLEVPDVGNFAQPDNTCASVMLDATRVTPNVVLVIDRSGSMAENEFAAGVTRWQALQSALLDASTGFVPTLESSVRFGVAFYSDDDRTATCPDLYTVPAQLSNAELIEAEWTRRTPPRGGTPTGEAIQQALATIDTLAPERSDTSPTFFILATDGEPNTCADGNDTANGRLASIDAVRAAHAAGIDTFVISVGAEVATSHLQDVANAGVGIDGAEFWVATDTAGLVSGLRSIIRGVASCDVLLEGMVDPDLACDGDVRLGGEPLDCHSDWELLGGSTIRLLGAACDRLQTEGSTLTASFPCEAILG